MEEQLAAYRARRAKEKEDLKSSLSSTTYNYVSGIFRSRRQVNTPADYPANSEITERPTGPVTISSDGEIVTEKQPWFTTETILKIVLWFLLWGVFLELGFGAVYFVVSLLIILYRSTRTVPKGDGKLSAYSVFNPNCERIDGTFTAEQFEKELRHGPGAVH